MIDASIKRMNSGVFSEETVKSILIYVRNEKYGGLIREVGDLVAHPERDKGFARDKLFEFCLQMTAVFKYKLKNRQIFPRDGSCDWWTKPFLLSHIKDFRRKEIIKNLGCNEKELKKEILEYFDESDFPVVMKKYDKRFAHIFDFMSSMMSSESHSVFDASSMRSELRVLFSNIGVDKSIIDLFIIAIMVIFHKSNFVLPNKIIANSELNLSPDGYDEKGRYNANICVSGSVPVLLDNYPHVTMNLISSEFRAVDYIEDSMFKRVGGHIVGCVFDGAIYFDSNYDKPVRRIG